MQPKRSGETRSFHAEGTATSNERQPDEREQQKKIDR